MIWLCDKFLAREWDTAQVCQSIACEHPPVLDEHKIVCPHLLLYHQDKWRLEIGSCAEVRSDEFYGIEGCWEGACFENPVDVTQQFREHLENMASQGRLEAGSFPLC